VAEYHGAGAEIDEHFGGNVARQGAAGLVVAILAADYDRPGRGLDKV
jgi:hypothetical protein